MVSDSLTLDEAVERRGPPLASVTERATEVSGDRQLLVIVGSGRSGTSVLASVLREVGYKVPQPEVRADQTNPKGFGEPQWLVDFHKAALHTAHVQTTDARPQAWADTAKKCVDPRLRKQARTWLESQYEDTDHVLLKDPRILWFTTLWDLIADDVGAEPVYLTMLRPPANVVKSKEFWYEMPLAATNRAAGWINAMLYTERATRWRNRAYVSFDELLLDWANVVGQLDDRLGLPPVANVGSKSLVAAHQIVEPELSRSHATWEQLGVSRAVSELTQRVWETLQPLRDEAGENETTYGSLEQLRLEYRILYQAAEDVAQSSILAAKRKGVVQGRKGKRTRGPTNKKQIDSEPPRREPAPSTTLRTARLLPGSVRHIVPTRVRQKIVRLFP